jgi:hypothetical protein
MLRWRAAARCSSGRRLATWPNWERPARGREAAGQRSGWHVARSLAAQRRQGQHTWPGERRRRATEKNRGEGEREVDEGGSKCNFREMQGPYCNASITFKPVLKWRWAQKKKCLVFHNIQLYFKVHP